MNFTYYREGAVADELEKQNAAILGEQLKKDCCALIYRNELDYLSSCNRQAWRLQLRFLTT